MILLCMYGQTIKFIQTQNRMIIAYDCIEFRILSTHFKHNGHSLCFYGHI